MIIWQNQIQYDKIQYEIWHSPITCRDHPTAAEAWTESRTDATAAEPVFLSDFSKNIFPQKYLRLSPDIRKYFSEKILA